MTPPPDTSPTPVAACKQCGYDMRGLREAVCPECGTHVYDEVFRSTDPVDADAAILALRKAGIDAQPSDAFLKGAVVGSWMGQSPEMQHHAVLVPRTQFEQAEEVPSCV